MEPAELDQRVNDLLRRPPYALSPAERQEQLLPLFRARVLAAAEACPPYGRYIRGFGSDPARAASISELPYLPVSAFKRNPPLATVPPDKVFRVLLSSATTGQSPSRIAVDRPSATRMSQGAARIVSDAIGPARRPLLVVDTPGANAAAAEVGARGAAIRAVMMLATETHYVLSDDSRAQIDLDALARLTDRFRHGEGVMLYGFTWLIWQRLVRPLRDAGRSLGLANAHVLHGGGWKRLQSEAVDKPTFNAAAADVVGTSPTRVIDCYGMVENGGILYADCPAGNKHAPTFGEVIVRDPTTLAPVPPGGRGIIQVGNVLPASYPGHLLLTEDMGELVCDDGCPCGRRGVAFRFAGRIPQAELRGCGDIAARRAPLNAGGAQ